MSFLPQGKRDLKRKLNATEVTNTSHGKKKILFDVEEKNILIADQVGLFQEELLRICLKWVLKSHLGKVYCDVSPLQTALANVLPVFLIVNILWN